MPGKRKVGNLAAVGSTGNNSHASLPINEDAESLMVEFEITAVGATPTVTYKLQGSNDDSTVADGASDWFDMSMLPSDANAEVASAVKTAVGVYEYSVNATSRGLPRKVRLVTSANTNVTYESELYSNDQG